MFFANHFLTAPVASPELAASINGAEFLEARMRACWDAAGQIPNLVTVDYYRQGGLFEAVNALNGVGGEAAGVGSADGADAAP